MEGKANSSLAQHPEFRGCAVSPGKTTGLCFQVLRARPGGLYNETLDIWLWGVTHYGTSWDYVLTNIRCNAKEEE